MFFHVAVGLRCMISKYSTVTAHYRIADFQGYFKMRCTAMISSVLPYVLNSAVTAASHALAQRGLDILVAISSVSSLPVADVTALFAAASEKP